MKKNARSERSVDLSSLYILRACCVRPSFAGPSIVDSEPHLPKQTRQKGPHTKPPNSPVQQLEQAEIVVAAEAAKAAETEAAAPTTLL